MELGQALDLVRHTLLMALTIAAPIPRDPPVIRAVRDDRSIVKLSAISLRILS